MKGDSMWKLLMGMRVCGLKNDALMETFYEIVGERYQADGRLCGLSYFMTGMIFRQREKIMSVRVNPRRCSNTLICAICPVSGDYEPGEPECGFLIPGIYGWRGSH